MITTVTPIRFRTCDINDHADVIDFLYSIRDELYFSEYAVAAEIADLLYERGGVIGGYHNGQLVGLVGYFYGQEADSYTDKQTALIYVAGLAKPYRSSGIFAVGLRFLTEALYTIGVQHLRLHVVETDKRLNAIYSTFATPLRTERNRRGLCCVLYGNTVEAVLAHLQQRRVRSAAYRPGPDQQMIDLIHTVAA